MAVTIIAALTVFYLLICLLAYVFQGRLVFFPERTLETTPIHVGMPYRDVRFPAEDGVSLHGWFVPAEAERDVAPSGESTPTDIAVSARATASSSGASSRATVLFCHGNAGNISHRLDTVRMLNQLGLSVFLFDYRGYGQSSGRASEAGTYADAWGAWQFLTQQEGLAPDEIVLLGRSLGGAVAIELATRISPRALIVESTFTSAVDLGARVYPWLPIRQLARIRYDSTSRIRQVRCPKLFVHSIDDEIAPYGLGLRLYGLAREPKQWLKIRGGHNDGFLTTGRPYVEAIESFIATLGV